MDYAFALLPLEMDTDLARLQVFATGIQESNFEVRRQANNGPAVGFFQFERVGIQGVMEHKKSGPLLRKLCEKFDVVFNVEHIWTALQSPRYDALAICIARLNYWISPLAMPSAGNMKQAWEMYQKTWRPGKPHSEKWIESYWRAYGAILG